MRASPLSDGQAAGGRSPLSIGERETAGSWAVHRQDDNGNRFVVRTGLDREAAIRLASELEARGHKQLYWAEAAPAEAPSLKGPAADV